MSMQNLLKAYDLIKENPECSDFDGCKTESLVEFAELTLNLKFPPTYRNFLIKFGCGGLKGLEIYGIVDDDFVHSNIPDGVWLTLENRRQWHYPEHLIVIGDTGDGLWYSLDSSKPNQDGEYPVVIYNPDAMEERYQYEKISEDFGDFLLEQIKLHLSFIE